MSGYHGRLSGDAQWRSLEGVTTYGDKLQPGDVVAIDYVGWRHRPWVVHDIRLRDDGAWRIILRPFGPEFDFAQHNHPLTMRRHGHVRVLPEHFAVCHRCGELPPCSEAWTSSVSGALAERAARYEVEGVCPACQKPVTHRQKSHWFSENLYVPLGPPVVFHAKNSCSASAVDYDLHVARAHDREPTLSCEGRHVQHNDGHHECSNITCPGTHVRHRSFARCYVLRERCNRPECWAYDTRNGHG